GLGADVYYDYEVGPSSSQGHIQPTSRPGWLAKFLGTDLFHRIVGFSLRGQSHQQENDFQILLPHVSCLPHLRSLTVDNSNLTDDDLKSISQFTQLEYLHLAGNDQLTGVG